MVYICFHWENECNSCIFHYTNDFTSSADAFANMRHANTFLTSQSTWPYESYRPPNTERYHLYLGKVWTFRRFVWCHDVNLSPKVPLGTRQKRQDAITVLPHKQALIKKLFILISKCISALFFLLTWSHCLLLQLAEIAKTGRNSLAASAAYRFFCSA